jgi:dihydrofolate reductase
VAHEINGLKSQDGYDLWVHGSSNLIQTLLHHKLIDEYRLWIFPLTLGNGKRLFGQGTIPSGLKLMEGKISSTGVILVIYQPVEEFKIGTFELENPSAAEIARRERLAAEG